MGSLNLAGARVVDVPALGAALVSRPREFFALCLRFHAGPASGRWVLGCRRESAGLLPSRRSRRSRRI